MADPTPLGIGEVLADVMFNDLEGEAKRIERERKERHALWRAQQAAQGITNAMTVDDLVSKITDLNNEQLPDIRPKKEDPGARPAEAKPARAFPAPPRR